jgi:PKD repeat protein
LLFTLPNAYRFVLVNKDWLKCTRYDTLSVTINPQSVPHFISAADNRNFNSLRDTLCLNNPDTVFIKDSSYTASPFEQIKVTQWQWVAFEDTFDIKNPVIPAKTGGIQPIDLTITNEKGCVSSLRDTLVVQEAFAQWQTSRKRYCNGANVTFTNRSSIEPLLDYSGDGITCFWDWGDGTSEIQNISSGQFPSPIIDHRYNLPKGANDVVVITLRVRINGLDCENVYKDSLTIGTLNAGFTVDERYFPCPSSVGRTLTFSDTSRGTVTYYRWNFGDTASGSDNEAEGWNIHSPIHKYSKAGTYDVKLTVEDNIGCIDTLVKEAYIFIDGPSGDFSYLPLSGCVPLEVRFFPTVENTDTIIVNPNLSLEIVRGGIYVDSAISYTYEQIGAFLPYFYLIKWTTDSEGNPERCVWDWQGKDTIFVVDILPKFSVDSLYCIGVSVLFEDESTVLPGNLLPDSVHWDFGNGQTANTSAAATQYDSAGSYNTTMSIYVKNCVKTMSLPIEVMPFPELFFHPDTASACNNLEVLFFTDTLTEQENARITGYNWTFSDGEHYTSNPIRRTFTLTGWYLYDVLLSFIPENCVKLYNDSIYVNVFIVPTAEFEPTPPTVRMGETIHFVDKSQQGDGNIISWRWDIGEDTYSQEQSPKHVYKTLSGYVTVYLVIADTNGCTDSIEHQVLILENLRFPNIFTAQAFRPDGRPYVFRPLANEGYFKEFSVAIYNRHGMLVWKQSCKVPNCPDYDNDAFWWNGKSQFGEPVPDGVYYWVVYAIPLSETQTFILNGSVTIVR